MKMQKFTALALLLPVCFACNQHNKKPVESLAQDVQLQAIKEPEKKWEKKEDIGPVAMDSSVKAVDEDQIQNKKEEKPQQNKSNDNPKLDWDKKIIKTAALTLEVKDYKTFDHQLRGTIKQFGGYISQEEQNESAYKIENTLSIKVPVGQFEDAMDKLCNGNEKTIEKKITSEDVTTEVVDTKSRIEAKKQARLRYLDLLKQAKNMDEILQVQNEINDIQEQLESASGRVSYLNHSSAFSTINLNFYQVLDATGVADAKPSYFHEIGEAFAGGLKWVSELLLGLVSLWPLIILASIGLIAYRKRKTIKPKTT